MASPLPSWLPYETKDCSQGFCSIYCPQWCYIIFPPPPPFFVYDEKDDSSSEGSTLSPLVIAIIGVLASAILLVSYYTLVSKYCRRRGTPLRLSPFGPAAAQGRSHVHDTWHSLPSDGLDESVISKIQMYIYRRGDGVVGCSDCSVCLGEFREDESLRLLPKCRHAFHVRCIDTWLRSHSNCPLCRANIVLPPPPPPRTPEIGREENHDMVVIQGSEHDGDDSLKETPEGREGNYSVVDIGEDGGGARRIRRSFSLDSSRRGRISVADILKVSMEDEYVMASCHTFVVDGGSCERETGEDSKSRSSHPLVSPVRMKRSVSSGWFGLMKGRSSVLRV